MAQSDSVNWGFPKNYADFRTNHAQCTIYLKEAPRAKSRQASDLRFKHAQEINQLWNSNNRTLRVICAEKLIESQNGSFYYKQLCLRVLAAAALLTRGTQLSAVLKKAA